MPSPAQSAVWGLLAVAASAGAQTKSIEPGSPAPPLSVKHWLKGKPVTSLAKNGVYVIEFWATWCLPCAEEMPHVTALARANPDITFIGVGIWEEWDAVKHPRFVAKMGQKMGYRVGYSGDQDGMAETWMKAGFRDSIPSAFVVKDGHVMWMGHPRLLDKPLAEIKAGTFDLAAFKSEQQKRRAKVQWGFDAAAALEAAQKLRREGKVEASNQALASAVEEFPENEIAAESIRFSWLADEDPVAWETKARSYATGEDSKRLTILNKFALARVAKPNGIPIARKALLIALEGTGWKEPNTLTFGTSIFATLKEDQMELRAVRALLEVWPESWTDVEEERTRLRAREVELTAKLKRG
ncbi:TlpA family protein disulfide reductase [bacterium]|nr:MAG: TlpA family protein disulfide reductase [bacterium]